MIPMDDLDEKICGKVMGEVAAWFVDHKEDEKAAIVLSERKRLGI